MEITIDNDVYTIPSSWNALSNEQILKLSHLSICGVNLGIKQFKTYLLVYLLKLKILPKTKIINDVLHFYVKRKRKYYILNAFQIASICEKLDFLFTEKEDCIIINSKLTRNPVPYIKIKGTKYYGPSDLLGNVSYSEFIHTEKFYDSYLQTQQQIYLDYLIATLWRKKGKPEDSGDVREDFNDFILDKLRPKFKNVDKNIKQAIFLFYCGVKHYLRHHYKYLHKNMVSDKDTDGRDNIIDAMLRISNTLANGDPSKVEKVRKSYLLDIMIALDEKAKEAHLMQENMKKLKRK